MDVDELLLAHDAVPRVLTIVNEAMSASWMWRVLWPHSALTARGFIVDWILDTQYDAIAPMIASGRYNVIVMSRVHFSDSYYAMQWSDLVHRGGASWIYGADDYAWGDETLDPLRLTEAVASRGRTLINKDRDDRIAEIRRTDGVLVSTPILAEFARALTDKPVVTIPNLIWEERFTSLVHESRRAVEGLTVGWSGSFRPDSDLAGLAEVWTEIAERYPRVTFVMHGGDIPVLRNSVPSDRLVCLPWGSLDAYAKQLCNIDIMCCYLPNDSNFCRAKSPIKWMEASLAGCACVVSDTVYGQTVRDEIDALVAFDKTEWVHSISLLIENQSVRDYMVQRAATQIRSKFSLESNWKAWLAGMAQLKLGGV